jgi:hypothetical protein
MTFVSGCLTEWAWSPRTGAHRHRAGHVATTPGRWPPTGQPLALCPAIATTLPSHSQGCSPNCSGAGQPLPATASRQPLLARYRTAALHCAAINLVQRPCPARCRPGPVTAQARGHARRRLPFVTRWPCCAGCAWSWTHAFDGSACACVHRSHRPHLARMK